MSASPTDEVVQYIVIRNDIKMSKGKIVPQGGHAVQLVLDAVHANGNATSLTWRKTWAEMSYTKIALQANLAELEAVADRLATAGYIVAKVVDEGRTQVAPGSITALGIQPAPKSVLREYLQHLNLL